MRHAVRHYINGAWVDPVAPQVRTLYSSATGQPIGEVALGNAEDVERAVAAASAAQPAWAATSVADRLELLRAILAEYQLHMEAMAEAIRDEIGAPISLCRTIQTGSGMAQLMSTIAALEDFSFEERIGHTAVVREPIGVCGLITPWNWPLNQIAAKVAPALAAGCTMVLKPSEITPFSADIWAEVLHRAGVPAGVFNMVHGDGPGVGSAISSHPDVMLVSFTGSTRAGVEVARAAAPTVKRVAQELGGKSPAILLDDADFEQAVRGVMAVLLGNAGQTCVAPSRLLVPRSRLKEVEEIAVRVAKETVVGDPSDPATTMGPVSSEAHYNRVLGYIRSGIEQGARLVTGGPDRPAGLREGCYVQPTVFSDVTSDMVIAVEEIFGPVLVIMPYDDEAEAVRIANDTVFGLAGYVWTGDIDRGSAIGRKIQAGLVHINGAAASLQEPFGGYRQSGNGREWGPAGISEFLETKSVVGAFAE